MLRLAHAAGRLGEAQARAVATALRQRTSDLAISLIPVAADPFGQARRSGQGETAKTDSLGRALQTGLADAAVRNAADYPFGLGDESMTVVALPRYDPRDALVSRNHKSFSYLPPAAAVITCGAHRRAQLLRRRHDLSVTLTAASAESLLALLDAGACDAVVVAGSELLWLDLQVRVTEAIDTDLLIPAAGQGALLVQTAAEGPAAEAVAVLHDVASAHALQAEQACMRRLGPPVDAAVAIHAATEDEDVLMHGIVAELEGGHAARLRWRGPRRAAEDTGATMAELLLAAGGREILAGLPLESTGRYTFRIAEPGFGRSSPELTDDERFPLDGRDCGGRP